MVQGGFLSVNCADTVIRRSAPSTAVPHDDPSDGLPPTVTPLPPASNSSHANPHGLHSAMTTSMTAQTLPQSHSTPQSNPTQQAHSLHPHQTLTQHPPPAAQMTAPSTASSPHTPEPPLAPPQRALVHDSRSSDPLAATMPSLNSSPGRPQSSSKSQHVSLPPLSSMCCCL